MSMQVKQRAVESITLLGTVQISMQVKQIAVEAIAILGTIQTMNMHHDWQNLVTSVTTVNPANHDACSLIKTYCL